MGRDELSEEYYDDDDMWLSDDDWDEREPPSEETLSKLRECFPRMRASIAATARVSPPPSCPGTIP